MNTIIVAAFPGMGKTYYHSVHPDSSTDSCSSLFSWIHGTKTRNPDFPNNYIKYIKDNLGGFEFIFISTHKEVRAALIDSGLQYHLVYPYYADKIEYAKRLVGRGSPKTFVDMVISNWDVWMDELYTEKSPLVCHYPTNAEDYLDNILPLITATHATQQ